MRPIPSFRPRRLDDEFVDRWDGFKLKPILPHKFLPHETRRDFDHNLTKRCGSCGEFVKLAQWQAHKEYCWGQKWMDGVQKGGDKKLKVSDRAWAKGERDIRK